MIRPPSIRPITREREIAVYRNRFGSLYDDQTTGPLGHPGRYLRWIWSHPAVVIVPFRADQVALCWMYRYPVGTVLLEFPRGGVDTGEPTEQAALRELREETGLVGPHGIRLGRLYTDSGLIGTDSEVYAVPVSDEKAAPSNEPMESIAAGVLWLDRTAVSQAIADGEITCGITMAAWAMFMSRWEEFMPLSGPRAD